MAWVMGTTIADSTMISAINSDVSIPTSRFIFFPAYYCIDIPVGCEEIRCVVNSGEVDYADFCYLPKAHNGEIFLTLEFCTMEKSHIG